MKLIHVFHLLLLSQVASIATARESRCSNGASYACPVCDGTRTVQVSDCLSCDGYLQTDIKHSRCINRHLFDIGGDEDSHYHYWWNDMIGAFVWFATAGVAIACGVGGGGIFVPLGILLFQFAPKPSSGLSQASIFGSSLGGLILNAASKHPNQKIRHDAGVPRTPGDTNKSDPRVFQEELTSAEVEDYLAAGGVFYTRPLIDFDMSLFMSPMITAGAVLGVLVQAILPNWLYMLSSGLILGWVAEKTYKKYFETVRKEHAQKAYEIEIATKTSESRALLGDCPNKTENQYKSSTHDHGQDNEKDPHFERRRELLLNDMRQFPAEKVGYFVVLWIGLFIITLLKGGKGFQSLIGIHCDSPWYGILTVCEIIWLLGFAADFGLRIVRNQEERVAVQYPFLPDDPSWDYASLRFYTVITFMSGFVAGLVGIGGGMVLGPLMIIMGIHPQVASATGVILIVLTSSSVAIMFITSGMVPWTYALFYSLVCFAGALFGKSCIDAHIKRTGRSSILIVILASIIAFATVGCLVVMFSNLSSKHWCFDGFKDFCDMPLNLEDLCPLMAESEYPFLENHAAL